MIQITLLAQDLSMLKYIPSLIDIGVRSFKNRR